MKKRYSKDLLRRVRNDIPIDDVISQILDLPCKISEGYFRFSCPLCHQFNTATKPETNLARCFRCEKNFNPIDICKITANVTFLDAMEMLLPWLPNHERFR